MMILSQTDITPFFLIFPVIKDLPDFLNPDQNIFPCNAIHPSSAIFPISLEREGLATFIYSASSSFVIDR